MIYIKEKFSHVWLFATPQTVVHQAPQSMGFSRHEYWSGLPFPFLTDIIIYFKNVKKGKHIKLKQTEENNDSVNKSMKYKTKAIEEINNKNF